MLSKDEMDKLEGAFKRLSDVLMDLEPLGIFAVDFYGGTINSLQLDEDSALGIPFKENIDTDSGIPGAHIKFTSRGIPFVCVAHKPDTITTFNWIDHINQALPQAAGGAG